MPRPTLRLRPLFALVLVAACSSGGDGAPIEPPTPTVGAPASVTAVAGANATAEVGAALEPAVVVKDANGKLVANTPVTFAVVSGNGTLTSAAATTGADGVARTTWTLGIATGAQQLTATAGTASVTISATATVPAGCAVTKYALGASLDLAWDANDCTDGSGRRYDRLQFTTTTQQMVDAAVTGASGRQLQLLDVARNLYVGLQPGTAFSPVAQNPMHLKYVLAPGSYEYRVTAPDAATTGAYKLATTTGTVVDCNYIVFATPNVQFTDAIKDKTYNCTGPTGFVEQWVNLQLRTGMKMRITLSGAEFVPLLVLRDDRQGPASPTLVTKRGTAVGETLVIDWTATFDSWHEIIVAPLTAQVGKYTLKIEELP